MPPIKSSVFKYYTYIILTIFLLGKIISPYFCYKEKKLVYIAITALSDYQPSFYAKCT